MQWSVVGGRWSVVGDADVRGIGLTDHRPPTTDHCIVCAATSGELAAFPNAIDGVRRLVSGVGIPATLAALIPLLGSESPQYILNIGIAGAYPDNGIAIGDIVIADGEVYGDVGFELPEAPGFRSIMESDFGDFYQEIHPTSPPPFPLPNESDLPGFRIHTGRGCTVNTCTGKAETGRLRARLFGAVFETMEGAAAAQAAAFNMIPFCEIRAISNIAADRDMRPENIRLALGNLERFLAVLFV